MLHRLYKSVGDFDVLKGIFASRLGTQDITSKAMDAEMSGDYQTAVKLYSEVKYVCVCVGVCVSVCVCVCVFVCIHSADCNTICNSTNTDITWGCLLPNL